MKTFFHLITFLLVGHMAYAQCVPGQVTEVIPLGGGIYQLEFEVDEPTSYIMIDYWFYFPGSGGTGNNVWSFETEGWHPYHLTIYWADPADPTTTVCTSGLSDDIYIPCDMVEAQWSDGVLSEDGLGVYFDIAAEGGNGDFTFSYQSNADYEVLPNNVVYVAFSDEPYASLEFQATDSEGCQSNWMGVGEENPNLICHLEADWYVEEDVLYGQFELLIGDNPIYYPVVDWHFGDGENSICYECPQNVYTALHTYMEPGTYDVCVYSLDDFEDSCPDTVCQSVVVGQPVVVCPTIQNITPQYLGSEGYALDVMWSSSMTNIPDMDVTSIDDVNNDPNVFAFDSTGTHEICISIDWSTALVADYLNCPTDTCIEVVFDCANFDAIIYLTYWDWSGTILSVFYDCTSTNMGCTYVWDTENTALDNEFDFMMFEGNPDVQGSFFAIDALQCVSDTVFFFYEAPIQECDVVLNYTVLDSTVNMEFELIADGEQIPNVPMVVYWVDDDNSVTYLEGNWTNAANISFAANGAYAICVHTAETFTACEAVTCVNVEIDYFVSVEEETMTRPWIVYPNPSTGWINVQCEAGDLLRILDAQGRLVLREQIRTTGTWSKLLDLDAGIYQIQRLNNTDTQSCSLIIQE